MMIPSAFDHLTMGSVEPLTEKESDFMVFILNEELARPQVHTPAEMRKYLSDFEGGALPGPIALTLERIEWGPPDLLYSAHTFSMATVLSDRPACSVLWAWTLMTETKRKGGVFSLRDWADKSPYGKPSLEHMHSLWLRQKRAKEPNGNTLDNPEVWK